MTTTRRSFIVDMLKVGVACTFLPGAGRIWKPTYHWLDDVWHPRITEEQMTLFILEHPEMLVKAVWTRCFGDEYLDYLRRYRQQIAA